MHLPPPQFLNPEKSVQLAVWRRHLLTPYEIVWVFRVILIVSMRYLNVLMERVGSKIVFNY